MNCNDSVILHTTKKARVVPRFFVYHFLNGMLYGLLPPTSSTHLKSFSSKYDSLAPS